MNTSKFLFSIEYQDRDLKYILNCIYHCYLDIISSEISIVNKENDIRDVFISDNYLDNHLIKEDLGIIHYKFDKEIQTKDGRVDIRVLDMIKTMQGEYKPYYYIECKRIKGDKVYNDKYIKDGINRFVEEKYPTHYGVNGMIGFVVKSIDIAENTKYFTDLKEYKFIEGLNHSYASNHTTKLARKKITLYHLMLDFSSLIP